MPAEWYPHAATWACWPFDDEIWFGLLENVRHEYAQMIKLVSEFETVHLLVRDVEAHNSAKNYLQGKRNIVFHSVPLNDVWFRDNGPTFILKNEQLSCVKWNFNAWGNKFDWNLDNKAAYEAVKYLKCSNIESSFVMEGGSFDVNGRGVALTTKQCLLNPKRNPQKNQLEIEEHLKKHLGLKKVIWLKDGLEGDHTDGHIDTIVRFVDESTILYSWCKDKSDPNHDVMQENFEILQQSTDADGKPFKLIPLPLPKKRFESVEEGRLPATYANFYIGNGFVVVPIYGDEHDTKALSVIEAVFPKHKVVGLSSKYIICGGGSFHCLTQQQPVGQIEVK